ncbi:MAG TPA: hypothetical protein VH764_06485 [Gemmatimonadales bacterium]
MRSCLFVFAAAWPAAALAQTCEQPPRIPRHVIAEAMRAHGRYSVTSTTTSMLFWSDALLWIVRRQQREAPGATQFLIDHEDWFEAHREIAGVDYAGMPASARAAYEHGQDALVDHGPEVVQEIREGPAPRLALDVTIFSSDSGRRGELHYRDTVSVPRMDVFNSRIVRLRIVEYDSLRLFDDVTGISVRPLGFLSAIFALVGKPDLKQTRLAVSRDSWQVVQARVKVLPGISRTGTAAIEPDGRGHERVPRDRADLAALATRLAQPLEVRYGPPPCLAGLLARRAAARDCHRPMGGTGTCGP